MPSKVNSQIHDTVLLDERDAIDTAKRQIRINAALIAAGIDSLEQGEDLNDAPAWDVLLGIRELAYVVRDDAINDAQSGPVEDGSALNLLPIQLISRIGSRQIATTNGQPGNGGGPLDHLDRAAA